MQTLLNALQTSRHSILRSNTRLVDTSLFSGVIHVMLCVTLHVAGYNGHRFLNYAPSTIYVTVRLVR